MTSEITDAMAALKARLKTTWESGDYATFAMPMEHGATEFLDRHAVEPGTRVLDVACGAGQTALPLARAGADVTGIDIARNLVAEARRRAAVEDVSAQFDEGDAEDLPYPDASFDLVISLIGAMFAPRPERVANELLRVCRPGGRVIMGNWTPTGFVGLLFKTMSKHVPPPANFPSPLLWGNETVVRERFATETRSLVFTKQHYPFYYPFPPAEVVEFYRDYYGPTNRAFAALDPDAQARLRADLEHLWTEHNRAKDGSTRYRSEYLEVVAVRA